MKDLIILGNGMAGMTAALYAKRANLDFKIVGRDEYDFGQIANAVCVENFPCAAPQSGMDLAMSLHAQLIDNNIQIEEHEVTKITQAMINHYGLGFCINYADGTNDFCKTVIYALGASHRKLNCEIEEGIPIHYCAICDGAFYKDKTVAVIGGGDVAFTQAEYLSKICEKVFIIMCDENVTAAPATFNLVSNIDNVYIEYNYPVDLIEYSKTPSHCRIINKSKDFYFSVDGIFIAIGMIPNIESIKYLEGIKITSMGVVADESGNTGVDGFFVAGDIRFKSVRQALTAAADGANAVNSVINYLKEVNK